MCQETFGWAGKASSVNAGGKTNGYTTTVTGWDLSFVTGEFGANLTGVNFTDANAMGVDAFCARHKAP